MKCGVPLAYFDLLVIWRFFVTRRPGPTGLGRSRPIRT